MRRERELLTPPDVRVAGSDADGLTVMYMFAKWKR